MSQLNEFALRIGRAFFMSLVLLASVAVICGLKQLPWSKIKNRFWFSWLGVANLRGKPLNIHCMKNIRLDSVYSSIHTSALGKPCNKHLRISTNLNLSDMYLICGPKLLHLLIATVHFGVANIIVQYLSGIRKGYRSCMDEIQAAKVGSSNDGIKQLITFKIKSSVFITFGENHATSNVFLCQWITWIPNADAAIIPKITLSLINKRQSFQNIKWIIL